MRLWYLAHGQPAKAQASLCICAVSPVPLLFAHMKYGSRQRVRRKIRHLAPVGWLCMRVWRMSLRRMKSAIISRAGSFELWHKKRNRSIVWLVVIQTGIFSVEPDLWLFVWNFLKIPVFCEQTGEALVRLGWCAGSPEPSLLSYYVPSSHGLAHLEFGTSNTLTHICRVGLSIFPIGRVHFQF